MTPESLPLAEMTAELARAIALGAAGLAAALVLTGAVMAAILWEIREQLRVLNGHIFDARIEGIEARSDALDARPVAAGPGFPLDAEQIVRGAGFLVTLWRQVLAKPGEAIPSAERLTLDLGKAMGVPLPVREEATAFLPGGVTVQSGLLPYGATSIPAVLDPEAV